LPFVFFGRPTLPYTFIPYSSGTLGAALMRKMQSTIANHTAFSDRTGELILDAALTSDGLILSGQAPQRDPVTVSPPCAATDLKPQFDALSPAQIVSPRVVSLTELAPNVFEVWVKAFIVATKVQAQEAVSMPVAPDLAAVSVVPAGTPIRPHGRQTSG
jgi:hypothetical protein